MGCYPCLKSSGHLNHLVALSRSGHPITSPFKSSSIPLHLVPASVSNPVAVAFEPSSSIPIVAIPATVSIGMAVVTFEPSPSSHRRRSQSSRFQPPSPFQALSVSRECHVKNANENTSSLWYHIGNGVIRFSPVEFCLVSGLTFGAYSESTLEIFKRKDSRLRRSYFQDSKVHVKMMIDWFRNLGLNNKYSDDDIVKSALILILEMTLVGKDDRTSILYWALKLADDLDAFNKFLWGSFLYDRTFNFLSTCLLGRDDKFKNKFIDKLKEKVDGPVKRKVERYNVYGFVTNFQVWAIEAIPKWVTLAMPLG
ncbi:hypothetical protein Ddye_024315 [Dipteronia dyeriana]|uniref:DUF1985 domain-containing protein n=1 Tax=Dipteronia dyeriana TaxID=168575 RepID=A0AAD9TV36_9ROSI|nr:hypothetical protein Ddye_024315 [Dipteronia dyeriana]